MIKLLPLMTLTVAVLCNDEQTITLDIGGSRFTTTASTITKYPDSLLAFNYKSDKAAYFYDRDGDMFRHILNYLRSGKLLLPHNFNQLDLLAEEAKYFNLYLLHDDIMHLQETKRRAHGTVGGQGSNPTSNVAKDSATGGNQESVESQGNGDATDDAFECVIVCADEDGKVERWFSAPVDLRFENNGCLLGDCEMITGYSHILDYRDYTARPGNTVPDQFNIAAIVARLLKAGFHLTSSSSGMDEWHREFYFVFVRRIKRASTY